MTTAFDHIASSYDETFTHSVIGNAQRKIVRGLLETEIKKFNKKLSILELNCGTGHDAKWLAENGHTVLATDVSPGMINQCKLKNEHQNIDFRVMAFDEINSLAGNKYDLVFSNFGGLNCIDEAAMMKLFHEIHSLLNDNGKLVAVIMPGRCLWGRLSFLKGGNKIRSVKRAVMVNLDGKTMQCRYFSPVMIESIAPEFRKTEIHPVGFFIPPSHFENKMKRFMNLFSVLLFLENKITNFGLLADYADHFYISLKKVK